MIDAVADVLLDEVGVDRDGGGGSLARRRDHLCAGVRGVARRPDAGRARPAGRVDAGEAAGVELAAERGEEGARPAVEGRPDEDRGAGNGTTVGELDGVEAVVDDREAVDETLDDPDPARVERSPLGGGDGGGVREEDDVVRPLPEQVRVVDRAGDEARQA